MRIMHIITGLNDGGAEAALYRICTHDKESKHTVVSMMDQGKYGPLLKELGIKVFCLGMPRGKLTIKGVFKLRNIIKDNKPEVVQTWMYHANLIGGTVAKFCGIKSICWGIHNGALTVETSSISTIAVSRLSAILSRFIPSSIICCSRKSVRIHQKIGYDRKKLIYIPNGYDITQFRPDKDKRIKTRKKLGVGDEETLLGMVARYDLLKDHSNLIKALGILKRTRNEFICALIGTGMDTKNLVLKEQIAQENLEGRILLLGRQNNIPDIMNALDIHVLSSQSEAFPNVLAEAMACGTPCVTTDVGDAPIIVGRTGWIVPPQNPKFLAKVIKIAINNSSDPELWARRKITARERIELNFGIKQVIKEYKAIWVKS